ncbi:MAG TPA: hypothetical protein VH309_03465 [Elusimicrobiota bacterium]|nr:hypothetical protein [Elusimicrobiota bacterium]
MSGARARAGLLALSLLTAASAADAAAPQPRVATDARMDLMGLVELLSGAPGVPRDPFTDAAAARFSSLRGDPAVRGAAAIRARGASRGLLMQYAVYLSSPPELAETAPIAPYFYAPFGGRARLEDWRKDLSAFARKSGFLAWENETRAQRESFAAAARRAQGGRDLGAPLQRLLGARTWGDWVVFVTPFSPEGGSDSWIMEERGGRPQVVVIFGPYWDGRSFGVVRPAEFAAAAWPEAVFTMTYALSEACRHAFLLTHEICRGLPGLVNIEDCVQHYWVRELVARLVEGSYGRAAASGYLETGGGPYDGAVRASIETYVRGRARYRDLLDAAAPLYAPFNGGASAAACRVDDPARFSEPIYARRMAYYLEGRVEAGPDAKASAELEELRAGGVIPR